MRLFQAFGVEVSLHWSWLFVAFIELYVRKNDYSSMFFNVLEYVTLFAIVLMHEFGHALACRSVGGVATDILLWPLGGVALVNPPQRPGAWLWSVAAGPLVNVALAPLFVAGFYWASGALPDTSDLYLYLRSVMLINFGLLIFNLLPIYPLDGGKILQSVLWFVIGRARSLQAVSVLGVLGALGLGYLAIRSEMIWTAILSFYMVSSAINGFRTASALRIIERADQRAGLACPSCGAAPVVGRFWRCVCGAEVDLFEGEGRCSACQRVHTQVPCLSCGARSAKDSWPR